MAALAQENFFPQRPGSPSRPLVVPQERMREIRQRQEAPSIPVPPRSVPVAVSNPRAEAEAESESRQAEVEELRTRSRIAQKEALRMAYDAKNAEKEEAEENKATFQQYVPIFVLAGFKDLLDLGLIGSLPGIGWVVTGCITILMFLLLKLIRTNSKLVDNRFILRAGLVMIAGFLVEAFAFGLNFLPFETMTIFLIYGMDRKLSDKQIEELLGIMGALTKHKVR